MNKERSAVFRFTLTKRIEIKMQRETRTPKVMRLTRVTMATSSMSRYLHLLLGLTKTIVRPGAVLHLQGQSDQLN